ncbi:unnamed protein product [Heterotrigona itama]|uniref:Uncharacterized protein n=1 Tax=Heterotrigona itama TaxID=395501 RepID=A0A6V7HE93_9HYME|nr:unnamed protein product [Heterotrigona itama]
MVVCSCTEETHVVKVPRQELLMAVGVTSAKIAAFSQIQEEIPGIEGRARAADFDDPLSEISLTITHVRSLSAGNVISDPTKLGSSFMRAPAAREYTPSGCCCSAVEEPGEIVGRSLEDRGRNVTRPVSLGMAMESQKSIRPGSRGSHGTAFRTQERDCQ